MARMNRSLWKQAKLSNNGNHLAVKTSVQNNSYDFKMTDYMRLWSESISFRAMSSRFENQNPGMEIDEEELPVVIDEALSNPGSELNLETPDDKSSVKLLMSFETSGMKINWLFDCAMESPEKMYHHLFGPILSSLSYLLHERESLLKMVAEKDATLEKLAKAEGRATKRKYVAFDQKSFEESTLKIFDEKTDRLENIFEVSYQDILGHFEKIFEKTPITSAVRDDNSGRQISGGGQNDTETRKRSAENVISPTKSEKEEEEERRMEPEKKLAEKKASKKKKIPF